MKLGFPRVEVFSRIRIDGLIITAMELRVADGVANQAAADTRIIDPGARTMTASDAATLSIPVNFDCARGSGFARTRARLTDNTCATRTG